MKGMPTDMPPVKTTRCLSNKDAVPQKPWKNQDCKTISKKVEGNTVTWFIQCSDKEGNTIDSRGSITYKDASFDGLANNVIGKLLSKEGLGKHPEAFFLYRQTVV